MAEALALSRRIAEHVVSVRFEDLSPAVIAATKRSLLDAIGVMLAATTLSPRCDAFADLALADRDGGPCSLIGRAGRTSMLMAALANGALGPRDRFRGRP
jgi:2-methylcitrate dehydratase PrpD